MESGIWFFIAFACICFVILMIGFIHILCSYLGNYQYVAVIANDDQNP